MTRNYTWSELFGSVVYGFAFVMIVTTVFFGIFGFDLTQGNGITNATIKDQDSKISSVNSSASSED